MTLRCSVRTRCMFVGLWVSDLATSSSGSLLPPPHVIGIRAFIVPAIYNNRKRHGKESKWQQILWLLAARRHQQRDLHTLISLGSTVNSKLNACMLCLFWYILCVYYVGYDADINSLRQFWCLIVYYKGDGGSDLSIQYEQNCSHNILLASNSRY